MIYLNKKSICVPGRFLNRSLIDSYKLSNSRRVFRTIFFSVTNKKYQDMNNIQLNIIAAVDKNMGIGRGADLPWRIPSEFQYFLNMTSQARHDHLKNVIIIGRKTWDTMDSVTSKPFPGAYNIVLSRNNTAELKQYPAVDVCTSLEEALHLIGTNEKYVNNVGQVWVLGGAEVYRTALLSANFHRLYLSKIQKEFLCDIFFPSEFAENLFERVSYEEIGDSRVPNGIQTDEKEGVKFEVCVYKRR